MTYSGLLEWKAAQLGTHIIPVSQLEVEVLGGGAPTLLRTSEFLFVETRLVYLCTLCRLLTRGDR